MSATITAEPPVRTVDQWRAPSKQELKVIGHTVAKQAGSKVEDFFKANSTAIDAVLPREISAERLLKVAQNAIRQTPKLMECTVASLFGAVMVCATMGLEPNTHQGHVYLIPRKKRAVIGKDQKGKDTWGDTWEVQVQLGYKGRIELAYRSPKILLLKAVQVYKADHFEIHEGTEQVIVHRPELRGPRGEIIGFYAVVKLSTGEWLFEWMPKSDIDVIRDENSDSYGFAADKLANTELSQKERDKASDTPWISNYVEMGRKTAVNRISKYIPSTPAMSLAAALDDQAMLGRSQQLEAILDGRDPVASIEHDPEGAEDAGVSEGVSDKPNDPPKDEAQKGAENDATETQDGPPGDEPPAGEEGGAPDPTPEPTPEPPPAARRGGRAASLFGTAE